MRIVFARTTLPRHPLGRAALALAGLLLLGLFSAIGLLLAGVAVLALTGRALWLRLRGEPPHGAGRAVDPQVIEGEFKVVPPSRLPRS